MDEDGGHKSAVDTIDPSSVRESNMALAYLLISVDALCKTMVMALRDPREVWMRLRKKYRTVFKAAVDAESTKLQSISMIPDEQVIQYAKKIEHLVKRLAVAGPAVAALERGRALLHRAREEFSFIAQVIRATSKDFNESISQLIIHQRSINNEVGSKNMALSAILTITPNKKRETKCFQYGRKRHFSCDHWHSLESKK